MTVIGAERAPLSDLYHAFLRIRWSAALGLIVVAYLALNALFALGFYWSGGISQAREASFVDAFFFSVQTMGTIGYGFMYPQTAFANALVVTESVVSLLFTAVATGLVFAKFSRSTARIVFTKYTVIGLMNGVPTLSLRVGNRRGNLIMEATVRLVLLRTEHTSEGVMFFRQYDLALSRERSAAFSRSWTVLHPITPESPLYGYTPERMASEEVEIVASVVGTDDTSLQPVHARHRYVHQHILWGARHADVLSETPEGQVILDLTKFHDVLPTAPTETFPYSWAPGAESP